MQDDRLLTQYAQDGSQAAFSQLVARHLSLVYSTCLREIGSPALAEDAAQVVFLLLSRKAKSLRAGPSLAGWLYNAARFVAKDVRKQEARRQRREQSVMQQLAHTQGLPSPEWELVEPLLNDALSALKLGEREAVLLRFIEGHSLAETGAALGLSEDAARMRVSRAVEKMRRYLAVHGAAVTGAALTGFLTSEAARPVPASAAATITQGTHQALSGSPTANVLLLSKGVYQTMKIIKVKFAALAAAVLLIGAALPPLAHAVSPHKASVKIPATSTPQAASAAPVSATLSGSPAPPKEPAAPMSPTVSAAPAPLAEPATVVSTPKAAVPSTKTPTTADADLIQAMERYRLVTVRYQVGANTAADLSEATLVLAEARLRVAQNKPDDVLQNLKIIETQRTEMLKRVNDAYRVGAEGYSFADVKKANAALIEAKTRVSLYKAIMTQSGPDLEHSVDAAAALKASQDQDGDVQKDSAKSGAK